MGGSTEMQVYGEQWKKGHLVSEQPQDLRLMGEKSSLGFSGLQSISATQDYMANPSCTLVCTAHWWFDSVHMAPWRELCLTP